MARQPKYRLMIEAGNGGPADECWIWQGCLFKGRYGRVTLANPARTVPAHRYAYECHVGPIAEDMQIDHICGETKCWNPAHLRQVTQGENMQYQVTLNKGNTTGYPNVVRHKRTGVFHGRLQVNGERINVGSFKTALEAYEAVKQKRKELGLPEGQALIYDRI